MKHLKRMTAILLAAVMLVAAAYTAPKVHAVSWVGRDLEMTIHDYYWAYVPGEGESYIQEAAMPIAGKTPDDYRILLTAPDTPDLVKDLMAGTQWYDLGPAGEEYGEPELLSSDSVLETNHYYEIKANFHQNNGYFRYQLEAESGLERHKVIFSPTEFDDGHGQTYSYLYSVTPTETRPNDLGYSIRFRCRGHRIYSADGDPLMIETEEEHDYPRGGTKPFYDFKFDTDSYPGEGSSIKFEEVFWYPSSLSSGTYFDKHEARLSENDTFKKGESYTLYMKLVAYNTHSVMPEFGEGMYFSYAANNWIYNEMPTITVKDKYNAVLELNFDITQKLIDSISVTGLKAPVEGQKPQTSGLKSDQADTSLEIKWDDSSNTFDSNGAFIGGKTYKAWIRVNTTADDYIFLTDASKIKVNTGKSSVGPAGDSFYVTFTAKKDLSKATVTVADQAWTGSALTPAPTVKYGSTTLKKDTDYTVTYSNNTSLGTATVKVTGKGSYTGTKSATFKITQRSITPTVTLTSTSYVYDGKAKTPGVTVKDGSKTLKKDTDYTIAWPSGRKNVGTYKITVTLKGNYKGSATTSFKITAKPLTDAKVTLSKTSLVYNGKARKPAETVVIDGKTLVKDTDYTVSYANNKNAGTATVTITGKGNYKDTAAATFKITKKAQSLKVTAATKSIKYKKVKKATQEVPDTITVKGAKGTVVYTKASGSKYLSIVKKTGVIKVKKGTPKGTYKIKVKVTAKATTNYKKAAKTVTVKIKVK